MKSNPSISRTLSLASACLSLVCSVPAARSAIVTWDGAGPDGKWQTGLNWVGGNPPQSGDSLVFTGNIQPVNTNNFGPGTQFSGITFNNPAGIFNLSGNSITLAGNISDAQVVSTETIGLNLALPASCNVDVTTSGALTISGVVSGAGGITKVDGGLLSLTGANTFTGGLTISGGSVAISSDGNLGKIPAAATPGSIAINASALRTTNSFTIATNRGIALGPVTGAGSGTISVNVGNTTTYRGVMANAGTNGGLNKLSFGGLTLAGANSYTGPTLVSNGTVTLDFTAATAPANNVINTNSSLALGGSTAGIGISNFAALVVTPKVNTTNSQSFNGTLIDVGPTYIQANSNNLSTVTVNLGALSNNTGGLVTFLPPTLLGGKGNVTTTSTNVNGTLGGWAFTSGGAGFANAPLPTNLATVDVNGNIVNFTNYVRYTGGTSSGTLAANGFSNPTNNIMLDGSAGDVRVDTDNAGTTNIFNTLTCYRPIATGWSIQIGASNLVRLGKTGLIFQAIQGTTATWELGNSTGGANTTADQNVGTITAGGPNYNSPGELIFYLDGTASASANNFDVDVQIADNGPQGPVTVVKAGPGYTKFRGHNTYSGGTYYLQGRIQFAGTDVGTANPDALGTGPVFVFPGAYLYNPPAGFTNALFIAGNGTQQEALGALRPQTAGIIWSNTITLIGDATIGGAAGVFAGQISGPFNLTLGSGATVNGSCQCNNPANNWTGNTTMQDRSGGNNSFINGASEVIPNGFGFGNVTIAGNGNVTNTYTWDLHGFNETINGLSTSGTASEAIVTNTTTTNSTLIVGDNDASGSFGGAFGGNLSLVKVGGGTETLSGTNTLSGGITVSNGTLAISGSGSIANVPQVTVIGTNATTAFNVAGVTGGFTTAHAVGLTNGALVGNTSASGINSLSLTNAALTVVLNAAITNIVATSLTTAGAANLINISAVQNIQAYPTVFSVVSYGSLGGAGDNFAIGAVPSSSTAGFISNDVVTSRLLLVLTNGPQPLLWTGAGDLTSWDVATTTNWEAFPGTLSATPSTYHDVDSVTFDDTAPAAATNITLVPVQLFPSSILFTNNVLDYSIGGPGAISGFAGLTKQGSATLTVSNAGFSDFRGGVSVGGGALVLDCNNAIQGGASVSAGTTLQIGVNTGVGNPPSGTINCDGALVFDIGANLSVPNVIAGAGGITKLDGSMLTLSGANTYTGLVSVANGILQTGSGSALGNTNVGTVINSGATLDVNGQNLGAEPITNSGPGLGGIGAIINSGADQINALKQVIVSGDTVWGGTGRWDIRETTTTAGAETQDASLTGTGPYNLTKIGPNQISLVGVNVDNNLKNINVLQGEFDVQLQGTTLGDTSPAYSLTVSNGATLALYRLTQPVSKQLVLNGDGVATTLLNENSANTVSSQITVNGTNIWNISGTSLIVSGSIGGTGSLNLIGTATLTLNGATINYPGNTTVSGVSLILDSTLGGGGSLSMAAGTTLSGVGGNVGPVQIAGAVHPGDAGNPGVISTGALTMTNATMTFRLAGSSDQIAVNGSLVVQGSNTVQVFPTLNAVTSGQQIPVITYTGTLTGTSNNFVLLPPPAGYAVHIVDPATTPGQIVVSVDHVPQNLYWHGGAPGGPIWDVNTTPNWYNNNNPPDVTFGVGDIANFVDGTVTGNITLTNTVSPEDIVFANGTLAYVFTGPGQISGGVSGSSTFTVNGGASVTLANTGTNTYGGTINLFSGTLQIGNGGSGGSLGGGQIVDTTALVFNMNTNLVVTNNIVGTGLIQESGIATGVTVLTGNNTNFTGGILITSGTLKAATSAALGTNLSAGTYNGVFYATPITITNTGTLDITNGVNVNPANNPNQAITVSGAGAGGNGAIINSSASATFTTPNFSYVTFAGNTTIGGTGRLDWRDFSATNTDAALNTQPSGTPYQLTKIGTNRLQLTGVQVDPAFGHIVVQGGILGIQGVMPSLGEVTSNLVVFSNATLSFFNVSNAMNKNLIMNDGAIMLNESGSNTWGGPITLLGSNTFNIGGNWILATAPIGGVGSLAKVTGASPLFLAAAETYTGPTFVDAGSLCLTNVGAGDGSISDSSEISVGSGAVLDVIGRSDQLLTVPNGQLLTGNGTVNGSVAVSSGGTVQPGNPAGILTVSNSVSLSGTAILAVRKTSQTNAQLRTITGNITYGGALTVTNLGGNMKGGETFQIFNSGGGSYLGAFSATTLPVLGPGLSWNISALGASGTISVSGTLAPPAIGTFSYSAPTLSLSGSGGTPGGPYVVITSTNVAAPLSTWTPVVTNSFDGGGNFNWSGPVGSTNVTQFFDIRE